MKLLILLAIVAVVYASTDRAVYNEWKAHVAKYNRKYSSAEHAREGFANFAREYQRVLDHNKKFRSGQETFEAGLNQFSDMSVEEKRKFLGSKHQPKIPSLSQRSLKPRFNWNSPNGVKFSEVIADSNIPASVDYTKYGGTVRDQGQYGTCYSHASNKVVEMIMRQKFNQSYNLAPQQLVDCSQSYGNNGIDGGSFMSSFDYFINTGKCFVKETDYPYKGPVQTRTADQCKALCTASTIKAKTSTYVTATENDLAAVKTLLAQGPCFVSIYVSEDSPLFNYKSGLYDEDVDGETNHAVVAVGYGKMNGFDYIKILNSWGSWGDNGYAYIKASQLRVLSSVFYPNITLTA